MMDLPHASRQSLERRLAAKTFSASDCDAAIRGQRVPDALGHRLTQLCVIRGIRYHPGFATELRSLTAEFTRALNARSIMSNDIPDMSQDDSIPYCIWHPDVASETTCRGLVSKYPQMKYHVARACAVAGYTNLYRELDVLPEVHVAEEARDNGSNDIFNIIMSSYTKYSIMDDYMRSVNLDKPTVSTLNGDTAVRSSLQIRQKYKAPLTYDLGLDFGDSDSDDDDDDDKITASTPGYREHYFNITEDWCIDDHDTESCNSDPRHDLSHVLYTPLPSDLPAGNKDVLILMAAYYGDIDRYSRLRRPVIIAKEINCLMRGVYHNTLFARWWADQLSSSYSPHASRIPSRFAHYLQRAVTARYVMNNDLSRISRTTPAHELPYCIWYPGHPARETIAALVRRRPDMKAQVARTCVVANYTTLFDELDPEPDKPLLAEAKSAGNPHFSRFLEQKVAAGAAVKPISGAEERWKMLTRDQLTEPQLPPAVLWRSIDEKSVVTSDSFPGIYEGFGIDTGALELSVCARDAVLSDGQEKADLIGLYGATD